MLDLDHYAEASEVISRAKSACNSSASVAERVRSADAAIVLQGRFKEAFDHITDFVERGPTTSTTRGVMLIGPSGVGKTTIAEELGRRYARTEHEGIREIPLLTCSVPASPSEKNFAEALLTAMGDPAAASGSATQKTERLIHFLSECQTKALMIDETQTFVEHRSDYRVRKTAEWFKYVIDRSKVPTILVGLEDTESLLRSNQPLRRRFSSVLHLRRFNCLVAEELIEFRAFLRLLEERLKLKKASNLDEPATAMNLFFASDGRVGYVKKAVIGAMRVALKDGREQIEPKDLENAFNLEIWGGARSHSNPFSEKFELRSLEGPGEPFEGEPTKASDRSCRDAVH